MVLSSPAFTQSEKATFVIAHNDLDLQSILVDSDGNVTGIFDWDGCIAVPRCMGYGSAPVFLHNYWSVDFSIRNGRSIVLWSYKRYREIYANKLERLGCPEANFTRNLPIYYALEDAMKKSKLEAVIEIVGRLFSRVSAISNAVVDEVLEQIGGGDVALLEHVRNGLRDILDPADIPTLTASNHIAPSTEQTISARTEVQGMAPPLPAVTQDSTDIDSTI
jgi:hypothetical protein